MKIVVYTAIVGGYDVLRPPHPDSDCPHYCFTDGNYECEGWETICINKKYATPRLDARRCKVLGPCELFQEYDISIWIDGAVREKVAINEDLTDKLLKGNDLARFSHRQRNCAWQEVDACVKSKKDNEAIMRAQVGWYFYDGFPSKYGLTHTGVLIRRHNKKCEMFCREWWKCIRSGSWRDQLSFDYCRWKTDLSCSFIPGTICNNNYFEHFPNHPTT
jgi:hypothetical protein